jgi:hypothetical protein
MRTEGTLVRADTADEWPDLAVQPGPDVPRAQLAVTSSGDDLTARKVTIASSATAVALMMPIWARCALGGRLLAGIVGSAAFCGRPGALIAGAAEWRGVYPKLTIRSAFTSPVISPLNQQDNPNEGMSNGRPSVTVKLMPGDD